MKIDSLDETMICEKDDMQLVLSFFKDSRKMPEYLEKIILKYICESLDIKFNYKSNIEDLLKILPDLYIENIIKNIETMYKTNKYIDYSNLYESYLLYYLPANIYKVWKPLLDLFIKSLLKPSLNILDVGTGPGSIPLGIIEFYKSIAVHYTEIEFIISFTLIESQKEFLEIAVYLINEIKNFLPPNLKINLDLCLNEEVTFNYDNSKLSKFDIITMSNFLTLNEKRNQEYGSLITNKFFENLSHSGSMIIIEPGEKRSCIALKKIRNEIVCKNGLNVYSPCVGIWEQKDVYNCLCFNMVRSFWDIPEIYKFLVYKGLNKAARIDVPFNYIILRKDGKRKYEIVKNYKPYTKLINLPENIEKDVNIIAIIRTVIDKGKYISISLCDGSRCINNDSEAVWMDLSYDELIKSGIEIPLIAAEKISLKKVHVLKKGNGIVLKFQKESRLIVEY